MDATDLAAQKRFADQELLLKRLVDTLSAVSERTQDTDTRLRKLRRGDRRAAVHGHVTALADVAPAALPPAETSAIDPRCRVALLRPLLPAAVDRRACLRRACSRRREATTSPGSTRRRSPASKRCSRRSRAPRRQPRRSTCWARRTRRRNGSTRRSRAYNAVIQNYPRSSQVPEAYYKRGKAQELLGQTDAARASCEQLIKSYPETPQRWPGQAETRSPGPPGRSRAHRSSPGDRDLPCHEKPVQCAMKRQSLCGSAWTKHGRSYCSRRGDDRSPERT